MKKSFVHLLVLLTVFSLTRAKVWAQEEQATVTVSDIEGLSNRINELGKSVRVGLLLQVQAANSGNQTLLPKGFSTAIKPPTGGLFYNDLFLPKRAEISLSGDLNDKKIAYKLQYDPMATTTAKSGVSNGEQLKDYWIRLSYVPFADLQYGQYKYAQALEGRTPAGDLDFNNRALITSAFADRRDLAFQISGTKIPLGPVNLEYAAALVQGAGQNNVDNNDNKDLAGRIGLTVADADWTVYLGASGYSGWETTVAATGFLGARNDTGLEGRFTLGGLKFQGEFIQGQLEPGNNFNPWVGTVTNPTLVTFNNKNSNPLGWYLSASYRFQDFRLALRAESYDQDLTAGSPFNVNNDVLTIGLDWFQAKDKFKLTLDGEEHFLQYEALIAQAQVLI